MKTLNFLSATALFLLPVLIGQSGECCRTIQQSLLAAVGDNDHSAKISNPGFFQSIMSSRNKAGFQQIDLQDPQGRTRIVQVRYTSGLPSQTSDSATDICSPGDTESEKYANVSTNYYKEIKLTLDDGEFETFCATQSEFRDEMTRKKLNQLYGAINTDLVTEATANFGNFWNTGANAALSVPLISSTGTPVYWGETEILDSFEDAELTERPFLVGSGFLRKYTRLQNIACCNDGGLDISADNSFDYFRDGAVDSVIGSSNNIIGFAPGAYQLVKTNRFVGQFEKSDNYKTKTTVVDPASGLTLDLSVYYDWCENPGDENDRSKWIITWGLRYGLFILPTDLAEPATPWDGVNSTFHFQATCGEVAPCDEPS